MTNILQPQGLLLLVVVWVAGERPSFVYEPFYYSRPRVVPTSDPDVTLRSHNSHYRSIYRNKNYFVPPLQKATTFPPPPSTATVAFTQRTTTTTTTTAAATSQPEEQSDGPIVFEEPSPPNSYIRTVDSYQSTSVVSNQVGEGGGANVKIQYIPTIGKSSPPCAKDALYCETLDNYPKELLNDVLSRMFTPKEFQDVYGETTDNSTTVYNALGTTDLKLLERTGLSSSNYEETPLCSSVERTIYPRVARNKDNKWKYVVNHDEYIQGVRVEKCLDDDGQPCVFGETAPIGYQTACRQKYIYKKLLALTPEGKTSTDTFKLPSCCVCFVKKLNPLINRGTSPAALSISRKPYPEEEDPEDEDSPTTTRGSRTYRKH